LENQKQQPNINATKVFDNKAIIVINIIMRKWLVIHSSWIFFAGYSTVLLPSLTVSPIAVYGVAISSSQTDTKASL